MAPVCEVNDGNIKGCQSRLAICCYQDNKCTIMQMMKNSYLRYIYIQSCFFFLLCHLEPPTVYLLLSLLRESFTHLAAEKFERDREGRRAFGNCLYIIFWWIWICLVSVLGATKAHWATRCFFGWTARTQHCATYLQFRNKTKGKSAAQRVTDTLQQSLLH